MRIIKRPSTENNWPLVIALTILSGAVMGMFAWGQAVRAAVPVPTEDAPTGARLYQQYCQVCHGVNGVGYAIPNAPGLDAASSVHRLSDGEIQRLILQGGTLMPDHAQNLTTTEAADLVRLMHTWWRADQLEAQQLLSATDPLQP